MVTIPAAQCHISLVSSAEERCVAAEKSGHAGKAVGREACASGACKVTDFHVEQAE
jgi:hypothetical protein